MSNLAWVDPRISAVRVAGVRSYLLGKGWRLRPGPEAELLVFDGPLDDDGEPILEVVPASEHLRDFCQRVEELIAALSVLEDRAATEILTDILAAAALPPERNGGSAGKEHAATKQG